MKLTFVDAKPYQGLIIERVHANINTTDLLHYKIITQNKSKKSIKHKMGQTDIISYRLRALREQRLLKAGVNVRLEKRQ